MPRILTLTLALLALSPPAADATTYYAIPDPPLDAACTADDPCGLLPAIAAAKQADDEVELAAGEYVLTEQAAVVDTAIVVRGAPGTRPIIRRAGSPVMEIDGGAVARDLELIQDSPAAVALSAGLATANRLVVRAPASESIAVDAVSGTHLLSTVALAPGEGGWAIRARGFTAVQMRHVTAVGEAYGLFVDGSSEDAQAGVVNSIVRGGDLDARVLWAQASTVVSADFDHVAYRPEHSSVEGTDAGFEATGTITGDPLLGADGYHQLAGSPTIDAGAGADQLTPPQDVDGQPRLQGAASDVGADELIPEPPPDPTPSPTPTPTASPQPTPMPTPAPSVDPTLPVLLSASFRSPPVAGRPAELVVRASDPDSPLLGVIIDLGPFGLVGETACRTLRPSGAFRRGQSLTFTVPVVFAAPGLQTYTVEIRSGGCGAAGQSVRSEHAVQVTTGALLARAAQVAGGRCATSLLPRPTTERQLAQAVVCLMNRERAKRRLRPLKVNRKLVRSARAHTADMLARGYYNHQRPGGPTLKARTRRAKYRGKSGENLGLANGVVATPGRMMRMWMNSPLHRANILSRRFRAVGVFVRAKDPLKRMRGAAIYTVNFGTRK